MSYPVLTIAFLVVSLITLKYKRKVFPYLIPLAFLGYFIKIDFYSIPLSLPEVFTLSILVYAIIVERNIILRALDYFFRIKWTVLLIFFGATIGIATTVLNNGEMNLALGAVKGWIILPVIFYVTISGLGFTKNELFLALNRVVFVFGVYILINALLGNGIEDFFFRLKGPYDNANQLAFIFAPLLAGNIFRLIVEYINRKNTWSYHPVDFWRYRNIYEIIFFIIVSSLIVLWSQSYGAILGVIGSLFITAMMFFPKKRSWIILSTSLIFLVTLLIFSNSRKFDGFLTFDTQSSSSSRIQIWTVATNLVKENPVSGIGIRQFETQFNDKSSEILQTAPYEAKVPHPHNQYLDFLLHYSVFGLIGFLILLIGLVNHSHHFGSSIMTSIFLVFIIHGFFDTWYSKIDVIFMFWYFVAICMLLRHPGNIHPTRIVSRVSYFLIKLR